MTRFTVLLLFLIAFTGYSQDPYLQNSNELAEQEAINLTENYNKELALTAEQRLLFQQKAEEFIVRKQQIETSFEGKEKLDKLYQLKLQETAEMGDILTRPQLEVYKKVRPSIQPLGTVD